MAGLFRQLFTEDIANAWWGKLLISLVFVLMAVAIHQIIEDHEQYGGPISARLALLYWATGKVGAAVLFGGVPAVAFAVWGLYQWRTGSDGRRRRRRVGGNAPASGALPGGTHDDAVPD